MEDVCRCPTDQPIKLMNALTYNPFHCLICNLEVSPPRLDLPSELVDGAAHWNSIYESVYRLWLDSGDYEIWARDVLENLESGVNREGRELVKEINGFRRCFYWCFQDQSSESFVAISNCPTCTRELEKVEGSTTKQAVCEGCSLVFAAGA